MRFVYADDGAGDTWTVVDTRAAHLPEDAAVTMETLPDLPADSYATLPTQSLKAVVDNDAWMRGLCLGFVGAEGPKSEGHAMSAYRFALLWGLARDARGKDVAEWSRYV